MKITKRVVDQLQPGERDTFAWDNEVKGFGVRCRPSGAKFYILKTRVGGRQRWLTIGRHGSPWTADTARDEALRLLGQKASGKDPAAERDNRKKAVNIKELGERFLGDYVAHRVKPKTAKDYQHLVNKLIAPALGHHKIADLTRADVSRFHHDHRKTPYLANRALAVLSKMLNLAEAWGLRDDNTEKAYRSSGSCWGTHRHRQQRATHICKLTRCVPLQTPLARPFRQQWQLYPTKPRQNGNVSGCNKT